MGESEVFDQGIDEEVLVAKATVTLRSMHQSKIKPAPHLKGGQGFIDPQKVFL